ncbi:MAG: PAS domain S-box protein [Geobacteraceae bacterium]|nr:PAS domain S-box protein [Geobacteraceae bacterium]
MREEVRQAVQHMKETSIPVPSGELTLVRKDGSPVTVYSSHALIQTGGNQPMLFCLDIDLSDRKRMEEKLRRASNEWRRTFDSIPDMITIIDNNHRILRSNRATWQRLGCTMQEIDSQPCYTKFHGLNSPPDYCPHVQLMLDKQPHSSEVFEPRLNAWLDVTVTPLFDDEGKVTGSIHVAHDITELKEAEKVLRVSEEKFRLLFEMSNDAILITVPDGNILAVNPESCRMFGMTADELIQVGREKIIDPSDNRYRPALETRARTGEFKGELNFVRKNGEVFPADVSSSIFKDSSGNTRATVRIEDISERKLVEKELKHKNAEIEQFIYTVSHDLRSPLITIKAFLGYLGRDISTGDRERIDKDLDFMHNAADRMEALLNELLDMSRIGRAVESREQMTFQELVAEAQSAVTGQIATGKVDIRLSTANPILYGDRRRLLQIWQNLLDNALKYMGDQRAPRVEITVEQQGEETVFCVCDNGIGIAPNYHEKIFGIFEKLDSTAGGVGMGLTMVRRIVENCGGRIWVESDGVGSGSCFHFTLPKVVAADPVSSD